MRHKVLGLLLLMFIMCTFSTVVVRADEELTSVEETTTVTEQTTAIETTTVAKVKTKKATKTIKVNDTTKLKKVLKLNNKQLKKYDFSSKKEKIASVSENGVVAGVKSGSTTITVTSKKDDTVYAKVKVKVKNRYTNKSLRLMAAIICSEAENQSYAGKKAVGIVVMNRIRSSYFPNTLKKVIYEKGQFTPARNGSLNRSLSRYDNGTLDSGSIAAAKEVLNGDTTVSLNSGTVEMSSYLFFSRYLSKCRLKIGDHQFR